MFSNQLITYNRLKEIRSRSDLSYLETLLMEVSHCVYLIHSDSLNMSYIGETDNDLYYRIFEHWRNPHISGHLPKDFDSEDTYVELLDSNCDNRSKEYSWHDEHKRLFPDVELISKPGRPGLKGQKHKHSDYSRRKIAENHADVSGEKNPMYGSDRSGEKNPSYGTRLYHNLVTGVQRRFKLDEIPDPNEWILGANESTKLNCGLLSSKCREAMLNSEKHKEAAIKNLSKATEKGKIKWVFLGDKGYMIRYSQWNGRKLFNAKKVCKLSDWEDYCSWNGLNPDLIHYKTDNE